MVYYALFILNTAFLAYRFFRSRKMGERTVLVTLSLFLVLSFAMHAWINKNSWSLSLLEKSVLMINLFWLAGGPFFFWLEKKRNQRGLFQSLRSGKGPLAEIAAACRMLSEARQGALIAIQRNDSLESLIESGVALDAKIRREIIFSVFTPPGALHDGGMIIEGDRIAAAGVLFPLSKRLDLPTELGTRHRAGLGLSESTGALAIIVSEETGKISLADHGKLLYDVKPDRFSEFLESALKNRSPKRLAKIPKPKTSLSSEPVLR